MAMVVVVLAHVGIVGSACRRLWIGSVRAGAPLCGAAQPHKGRIT